MVFIGLHPKEVHAALLVVHLKSSNFSPRALIEPSLASQHSRLNKS